MPVICAECGEELLGSVNRCWRCGTEYVSRTGPKGVPPVRRAPIKGPLQAALEAEVLDDVSPAASGASGVVMGTGGRPMRRGSPFASPATDDDAAARETVSSLPVSDSPLRTQYPRHGGAAAGAILSILLGLVSFGVAFRFPLGAIITGSLGLGLGAWGLFSQRRGAGIVGLLLCCLALAVAGFLGAVWLYTYIHGVAPWESPQLNDPTL